MIELEKNNINSKSFISLSKDNFNDWGINNEEIIQSYFDSIQILQSLTFKNESNPKKIFLDTQKQNSKSIENLK
jgi:hypothetical protein